MLRLGWSCVFLACFCFWIDEAQSLPFPFDMDYDMDLINAYFSKDIRASTKRDEDLTPEERVLVERTRRHLAEVFQKNLMRLLSSYVRGGSRERGLGRQDDGDDDDDIPQFNPNTLPQVAALLATIFSGNLNLTGVVDKAFFLVPDVVRKQVSGIVKLISGKPEEEPVPTPGTTTTTLKPFRLRTRTTSTTSLPIVRNDSDPVTTEEPLTTTIRPYRTTKAVRRWPNAPDIAVPPRDTRELENEGRSDLEFGRNDELTEEEAVDAVENEILSNPKWYQTYVDSKSPRYFLDPLRKIFKSEELNLTAVYQVMPELFKGARQAFVLLESLGQVTGLTPASEDGDE